MSASGRLDIEPRTLRWMNGRFQETLAGPLPLLEVVQRNLFAAAGQTKLGYGSFTVFTPSGKSAHLTLECRR